MLGLAVLGGNDLYLVAGVQDLAQFYKALVHLGGYGLVADFRMDEVGEIQGGGAFLDGALVAFGREHVNVLGGKVIVDDVQEFQGVYIRIGQDILDAAEPGVHLIVAVSEVAVLLVHPVGGNAFFRNVVHSPGADLHFHPDSGIA